MDGCEMTDWDWLNGTQLNLAYVLVDCDLVEGGLAGHGIVVNN